jgi:exonuclease III
METYKSSFMSDIHDELSDKNVNFQESHNIIKKCVDNVNSSRELFNIFTWNVRCLTNKKLNIIKQYLDEWTRSATLKHTTLNVISSATNKATLKATSLQHNTSQAYDTTSPCTKELDFDKKNYFVDIIAFTETWLTCDSKFNTFNIKNYNNYCINRKLGTRGGGIMLYIHKKYQTISVDSNINENMEYLMIKFLLNDDEWHAICVYRPPNGDIDSFLDDLDLIVSRTDSSKLIICGDFNINALNSHDDEVKNYLDMLTSFNLQIVNRATTRVNKITGTGSLIDHILLDTTDKNYTTITSKATDLVSDHSFIILMLHLCILPEKRIRKVKRTNYNAAVSELFRNLSNENIDPSINCPNSYFNSLHDELLKAIDDNTKWISIKLPSTMKTLPVWADDNYLSMLNTMYNLEEKINRRKMNNMSHDILQQKFDDLDKIRDKFAVVKAKIYYRKLEIDNVCHAWKIINDLLGRERTNQNFIIKNGRGELLTNNAEVAELFQDKFLSTIGDSNDFSNVAEHLYLGTHRLKSFVFDEVSPYTIFVIIGSLNVHKSAGYDGIGANFLKMTNDGICAHLANIFNNMIRTGIYVYRMRHATVTVIPKNGKKLDIENCRPISILPQIDKVFEAILTSQLNEYFENNGLFDSMQYGFRTGRGCREAICNILHLVSVATDKGNSMILLSLDIRKAFDSVDHEILLRKLNFLGIRGPSFDLIRSFLCDRSQVVKFQGSYSSDNSIMKGVPQGSNLGPLLFNLMINDLSALSTHSKVLKYADDIILLFEFRPCDSQINIQKLSSDLSMITNYYEMNKLKINCSKSKFMVIGNSSDCLIELLQREGITFCDELTYLGFIIDSEMKLVSQVDKIAYSIGSAVNALRFLKQNLTIASLLKFFHGHIQSQIHYCAFALLRCRSIDIDRIQRLQSKALRIIYNLPDTFPSSQLFSSQAKNIMPVTGIIYYSALCLVKKGLQSKDDSLPSFKRLRSERTADLQIGKARRKIMSDDLTHSGVKLFNQLPTHINLESNFSLYKQYLKLFILSRNESLIKPTQFATKNFYI